MLKNCPFCGKRIAKNAKACPECGEVFAFSTEKKRKVRRNPRLLLVVCVVLVFVCIAGSLFFFLRPSGSFSPVGVYSGNGTDILVIGEDGFATYYCEEAKYSESMCPWTYDGQRLEIMLSKLHTKVYAKVKKGQTKILLESDSINWDDETFTMIYDSPNDYGGREIIEPNARVHLLPQGDMCAEVGGAEFIIPKHYVCEPVGEDENAILFSCTDPQNGFDSGILLASYMPNLQEGEKVEDYFEEYAELILHNLTEQGEYETSEAIVIAERPGRIYSVSGIAGNAFQGLSGYEANGLLFLCADEENGCLLYGYLLQWSDRKMDNRKEFRNIIGGAR